MLRQVVDQPPAVIADTFHQRHAARQAAAPQRAEAVVLALPQGLPARTIQPRRLAGQCRLPRTVEQRITANALAVDHARRRRAIEQQHQPLRRLGARLYRLRQRNAT
ncbi:hypothetical protein R1V99_18545, partial [Stenotrophomonas maltophilia]|nr:hypothetical protein [Stenotrophomonas maltophilia]